MGAICASSEACNEKLILPCSAAVVACLIHPEKSIRDSSLATMRLIILALDEAAQVGFIEKLMLQDDLPPAARAMLMYTCVKVCQGTSCISYFY